MGPHSSPFCFPSRKSLHLIYHFPISGREENWLQHGFTCMCTQNTKLLTGASLPFNNRGEITQLLPHTEWAFRSWDLFFVRCSIFIIYIVYKILHCIQNTRPAGSLLIYIQSYFLGLPKWVNTRKNCISKTLQGQPAFPLISPLRDYQDKVNHPGKFKSITGQDTV